MALRRRWLSYNCIFQPLKLVLNCLMSPFCSHDRGKMLQKYEKNEHFLENFTIVWQFLAIFRPWFEMTQSEAIFGLQSPGKKRSIAKSRRNRSAPFVSDATSIFEKKTPITKIFFAWNGDFLQLWIALLQQMRRSTGVSSCRPWSPRSRRWLYSLRK